MDILSNTIQINKSQAEHILKHGLDKIYGFEIRGKEDDTERELNKNDLHTDLSIDEDIEGIYVRFKGESWQSKMVQFEKLILHIV